MCTGVEQTFMESALNSIDEWKLNFIHLHQNIIHIWLYFYESGHSKFLSYFNKVEKKKKTKPYYWFSSPSSIYEKLRRRRETGMTTDSCYLTEFVSTAAIAVVVAAAYSTK